MPYKSLAQEHWAHTSEGTRALGGPAKVHEWDAATKGKSLPSHVPAHAAGGTIVANKGYLGKQTAYAAGGPVLGKESEFMKTPDTFRTEGGKSTDEDYGKGDANPTGHVAAPAAKGKSLKGPTPK